jgi:hypothetical protein
MSVHPSQLIANVLANILLLGVCFVFCVLLNWHVLPMLRRWRARARRGLCIHCKYSLDGVESNQCPECGKDGRITSPINRQVAYDSFINRLRGR